MIFNVNSGAGKQPVNTVPSTASAFTYDGSAKEPLWQNFDPEQLTIGGVTSAIDADTYTVYFTPKADYEWWDGTSTPKEVTWSIGKAEGSLTLSAISATVIGKSSGAKTFTVNRAGDGKISVTSSNTGIAEASVSGTTVTVTPKGYGTATITVSVAEGTNYTAPNIETYTITVDYLYLYKDGDKCTSATGGWGNASKDTYWRANGWLLYCTFNGDHMYMNHSDSTGYGGAGTANKINMSSYTTLKASVKVGANHGTNTLYMYAAHTPGEVFNTSANVSAKTSTKNTSSTHTISLNVSNISSSYVVFSIHGNATIYKVWLE